MTLENIVLVIAGTLTALTAGLMFTFAVAVNLGLGRLRDSGYLTAMQSINRAILNPVFLIAFVGPVLLLPLAAFLSDEQLLPMVIASVLYIVGVFGITMTRNVPLNERLDKVDLATASTEELAATRQWFEKPWNQWHLIRTLASIAAVALIFVACIMSR